MRQQDKKLVDAARQLLKLYGYYVDNLWHVDDVHFICEQNNWVRLTNQDAMEVFAIAGEQFDGEAGISWPRLEKALHTFLKRQETLEGVLSDTALS